jgi:hypothetical protein
LKYVYIDVQRENRYLVLTDEQKIELTKWGAIAYAPGRRCVSGAVDLGAPGSLELGIKAPTNPLYPSLFYRGGSQLCLPSGFLLLTNVPGAVPSSGSREIESSGSFIQKRIVASDAAKLLPRHVAGRSSITSSVGAASAFAALGRAFSAFLSATSWTDSRRIR